MTLFATLKATQQQANQSRSSSKTSTTSSSSLDVPTVVQLFASSNGPLKLVDAPGSSGAHKWPQPWKVLSMCHVPAWACLSYQTVQTATDSGASSSHVDLGVWNVLIPPSASGSNSNGQVDALMQIPSSSSQNKYVLTIDLGQPLHKIEPHVTRQQEALVRFLIATGGNTTTSGSAEAKEASVVESAEQPPPDSDANEEAAPPAQDDDDDHVEDIRANETTSLYQLRTSTFGLANEDTPLSTPKAEESDKEVKIGLLLCVILPPDEKETVDKKTGGEGGETTTTTNDNAKDNDDDDADPQAEYEAKQTRALLLYHVRKFAASLNATLMTVHPKASQHSDTYVTLGQTALLWRAFGMGRNICANYKRILEFPLEYEETAASQDDEKAQEEEKVEETPLLFGPPAQYQEDLLDSVLLRNAQNPGKWDAAKESLWTILPDEEDDPAKGVGGKKATTKASAATSGDQVWLTELKDSMDAIVAAGGVAAAEAEAVPGTPAAAVSSDDPLAALGLKTPEASAGKGGKSSKTPASAKVKTPAASAAKKGAKTPGTAKSTASNAAASASKSSNKDTAAFFESLLK